ncbi:STAS domain-containing protein [Kitasatospora sp. NPDC001660]
MFRGRFLAFNLTAPGPREASDYGTRAAGTGTPRPRGKPSRDERSLAQPVVVVTGEIDQDNAQVLPRGLAAAVHTGTRRLVVDVSALCDSRGLHVLVELRRDAVAAGRTVVVPGRAVRRLLEIIETAFLFRGDDESGGGFTGR